VTQEAGAFGLRSVTGSNCDGRFLIGVAEALGSLRDTDERGAEVALDVNGEGFDWGDIDYAATEFFGRLVGRKHEAVDAPQKRGESLAGAGGGEDQR